FHDDVKYYFNCYIMEILAKSEPQISLKEHIDDCLRILDYLKICFPKTLEIVTEIDFWRVVRFSVIMHDLGKAHSEFTKILLGLKSDWKRQRHEFFSLPFIDGLTIDDSTKQLIRLVVAGHHRDFERLNKDYISNTYSDGNTDDGFGDEGLLSYEDEFKKV